MNLWIDVASTATIFALGNILSGRFEETTPKWLRRHGIQPFTAEPNEQYYALRGGNA